jgi:hypothetical protein
MLTANAEVKRDIPTLANCMEIGTLVMSAGLNALAFTGGIFDATHWTANCLRILRAGGDLAGRRICPGSANAALRL